jgi:putative flippase GtrA
MQKTNPLDRLILSIAGRFGDKAKEVERFLKFLVVGGIGFVVDLGTLVILQATILPPTNRINVIIATTIAFLAAIASNFTWNRVWTYPDSRSRSVTRQVAQFTFISVIGWLGRTLWISLTYLPLGAFLMPILLPVIRIVAASYQPTVTGEARMGSIVAQIIGVVVVMFWNFFANRYWTYSDVDEVKEG